MTPARQTLLQARKSYSQCASKVEKQIGAHGLAPHLSEQIVGIGVAAEWVRRAYEMESITYIGAHGYQMFRSRDVNAPLPPAHLSRPDPTLGVVREIESNGRQQTEQS